MSTMDPRFVYTIRSASDVPPKYSLVYQLSTGIAYRYGWSGSTTTTVFEYNSEKTVTIATSDIVVPFDPPPQVFKVGDLVRHIDDNVWGYVEKIEWVEQKWIYTYARKDSIVKRANVAAALTMLPEEPGVKYKYAVGDYVQSANGSAGKIIERSSNGDVPMYSYTANTSSSVKVTMTEPEANLTRIDKPPPQYRLGQYVMDQNTKLHGWIRGMAWSGTEWLYTVER